MKGRWFCLWLLSLSACSPAESAAPARFSAPSAVVDEWSQLTWEERHDRMTWLVLPNMARLFQRLGGTEHPTLTCETCHGVAAEAAGYRMPRALPLPKAEAAPGTLNSRAHGQDGEGGVDEVTVTMARLLGKQPYDPATKEGFGCLGCHLESISYSPRSAE